MAMTPETTYSAILGKILAQKRKAMNMDQAEIAEKSGTNRSAWSRWESGESVPDPIKLARICKVLDTTSHEFLAEVQNVSDKLEKEGIQVSMEKSPSNLEKSPPTTSNKFGLFVLGAALGALITTIVAKSDDNSDDE